jgi:hypothetical protein
MTCKVDEGCPDASSLSNPIYLEANLCKDDACTITDIFHLNMIDESIIYTYMVLEFENLVKCAHGCKGTAPSGAIVYEGHRGICISDEKATDECYNVPGGHCEKCYHDASTLGMHDN